MATKDRAFEMKTSEIRQIIGEIAQYCDQEGLRFTEPRRQVAEIIAKSQKPMGAYDVLEALSKKIADPKPPTAYRAIEFLEEHGFIHRIESLNAYFFCGANHRHEGSQFLICDKCQSVTETHMCSLPKSFQEKVNQDGFQMNKWNLEIHGLCKSCAKSTKPAADQSTLSKTCC